MGRHEDAEMAFTEALRRSAGNATARQGLQRLALRYAALGNSSGVSRIQSFLDAGIVTRRADYLPREIVGGP
jgi:hypothetical protein